MSRGGTSLAAERRGARRRKFFGLLDDGARDHRGHRKRKAARRLKRKRTGR